MTKPDNIISTAPDRIYLDLGENAHQIKPDDTWADFIGRIDHIVDWGTDIPPGLVVGYVRADLADEIRAAVATPPAASGAAPAEDGYTKAFYEIASVLGIGARADTPENVFRNEMLPRIAALASREASPATLTDSGVFSPWNACMFREECRARAALASPQVAPPADQVVDWAMHAALEITKDLCDRRGIKWEMEKIDDDVRAEIVSTHAKIIREAAADFCVATPVQVAPTPLPRDATSADFATWLMGSITGGGITEEAVQKWWHDYCLECEATPVPLLVAPQDDARDAAEVLTDEQANAMIKAVKARFGGWNGPPSKEFEAAMSATRDELRTISTPAAKPTEPTLPTQGDAK